MSSKCLSTAFMLLFVSGQAYALDKLDVTSITNQSTIVVYGEVESTEFVWRENVPPQWTTDITIRAENILKGEANLGDDRVIFMQPGGRGTNPNTGREMTVWTSGTPGFEVGEKVLMFLQIHPFLNKRPIAHGGLSLTQWRKRGIKDKAVEIPYTVTETEMIDGKIQDIDKIKEVVLPIDLVLKLVEAAVKDPEETLKVEDKLKEFAKDTDWAARKRLPAKEFTDELKEDVKEILDKEETDEN